MSEFEDFEVDVVDVVGFDSVDQECFKAFADLPVVVDDGLQEKEDGGGSGAGSAAAGMGAGRCGPVADPARALAPKPSLFGSGMMTPMPAGSLFDGSGGFGAGGLFGRCGLGGFGGLGGLSALNSFDVGGGFDSGFHPTAASGFALGQGFSAAEMMERGNRIEDQMRKRRAEEDKAIKESRRKDAVERYRKKRRRMKEVQKKNGGKGKHTHYKARQALAKKRNRVGGRFKKEANPSWTAASGSGGGGGGADAAAAAAAARSKAAAVASVAAAAAAAVHASPCRAPMIGLERGSSGFALVA